MPELHLQVTADGLTSLRSTSPLAGRLGLLRPHDHLFASDDGHELAKIAARLDPVYEPYSLVRYKHLTDMMIEAAGTFGRIVLLGSGFDTRSIVLAERFPNCRFIEIDLPGTIDEKRSVLRNASVTCPDNVRFVGADLADPDLGHKLDAAGLALTAPAAVFLEAASFFLPEAASRALSRPEALGLVAGSRFVIDCWTAPRTDDLGKLVVEEFGRGIFGHSPFGTDAESVRRVFEDAGFARVTVTSLGELCALYDVHATPDPFGESWFLVTATV